MNRTDDTAMGSTASSSDQWSRLSAQVQAQVAEADAAVARARQHADQAMRLRATGTYRGVEVTVDAQGLLTALTFTERSSSLSREALAHAVQSAFRAALRELVEKHRRCTLRTWGESETGRRIVQETARRFGVHEPSGERP